jgi:RNA polymerase sigma factor (sigma-70 family)
MRHDRINTFYKDHRHMLYTYALSLTGCTAKAEDAVHTAICKMLSAIVLPQKLKPYAYRCIRNAAIDDWRKYAARSTELSDEQHLASCATQAPGSHDIETLLDHLAPEEKETIVLKALHGFTFREIAAISRLSINTISSRYRRGLQKLKTLCTEDSNG